MPKVELIAKRAGHYPHKVKIGERFKVSRNDAQVLIAVGAATPAPKAAPIMAAKSTPKSPKATKPAAAADVTVTLEPTSEHGHYLRRDLRPED